MSCIKVLQPFNVCGLQYSFATVDMSVFFLSLEAQNIL